MKKLLLLILSLMSITSCSATVSDEPQSTAAAHEALFNGKKVLVAYFSWGGTTRRMAQAIHDVTGGELFEIEPVVPYPTSYTPCTEVALEERDNDARPAIKATVADWDQYDIVFIGCPVWWHTAPMIISTFAESYDFAGKTVVPFCTYAATYRDETLQKIVELTPAAEHLAGLGTTGSTNGVVAWIERISSQWVTNHPDDSADAAVLEADNMNLAAIACYDIKGRYVSDIDSYNGLLIIRGSDGATRKILK